ncbi:hypothetical protein PR048_003419 [Dryococelus australis]|uniref:Uncharacterized protein n=1 Tax=Dryococelus australis TaxID=614101 RepID=A0ABQ9IPD3_9NEOP|nr:hypothetical protein PR048_003419 [Dryococelus australis]
MIDTGLPIIGNLLPGPANPDSWFITSTVECMYVNYRQRVWHLGALLGGDRQEEDKDNAPYYTTRIVKYWLEEHDCKFELVPPDSPDIISTEQLFDLKNHLHTTPPPTSLHCTPPGGPAVALVGFCMVTECFRKPTERAHVASAATRGSSRPGRRGSSNSSRRGKCTKVVAHPFLLGWKTLPNLCGALSFCCGSSPRNSPGSCLRDQRGVSPLHFLDGGLPFVNVRELRTLVWRRAISAKFSASSNSKVLSLASDYGNTRSIPGGVTLHFPHVGNLADVIGQQFLEAIPVSRTVAFLLFPPPSNADPPTFHSTSPHGSLTTRAVLVTAADSCRIRHVPETWEQTDSTWRIHFIQFKEYFSRAHIVVQPDQSTDSHSLVFSLRGNETNTLSFFSGIMTADAEGQGIMSENVRGAAISERLACSSPTKVKRVQSPAGSPPDFRVWESCRTMPLVGGFSWRSPHFPCLSFRRCSILTSITFIGSQDLAVKSRQIFTHSRMCEWGSSAALGIEAASNGQNRSNISPSGTSAQWARESNPHHGLIERCSGALEVGRARESEVGARRPCKSASRNYKRPLAPDDAPLLDPLCWYYYSRATSTPEVGERSCEGSIAGRAVIPTSRLSNHTTISRDGGAPVVTASVRPARNILFLLGCEGRSYKGYIGTRYKSVIATMRRALNWRASPLPQASRTAVVEWFDYLPDGVTGRRVFSGISRSPTPLHSDDAPYTPRFNLIGSKTSMLTSAQISSPALSLKADSHPPS